MGSEVSKFIHKLLNEIKYRDVVALKIAGEKELVVLTTSKYLELKEKADKYIEPKMTDSFTSTQASEPLKVLVTGGAGFVGANTVKLLCDRGHDVVVFDNLVTGKLEYIDPRAKFVQGDCKNLTDLRQCFSAYHFDSVFHFAASLEVSESVSDPKKYFENNVKATIKLLKVMEEFGVRSINFSSTGAVYGSKVEPIKEVSSTNPDSPYALTKQMCENMIKFHAEHYNFSATVMRYFNIAGSDSTHSIGDTHPHSHVLPMFFTKISLDGSVTINGNDYNTPDGTCVRDYVHVSDVARAHVMALEKFWDTKGLRIYNVGTGVGTSVLKLAYSVGEILGKKLAINFRPKRAGDSATTIADISRIKRELGFSSEHTLSEIITDSYEYFKKTLM